MANKDVVLTIRMTDNGIEVTQKKLDKLNTSTARVSETSNKAKRNLEGVAQRANSAGKDFSRLSQGMGGLVQAYATVAAQVFAVTAAYAVLKNAADFRSMIKSTENLSTITGRSFTLIAENIQKATRGALNYQQALESANKIGAVGLNATQVSGLSELAVKASQTFGGTTTDAINRFIGAIQKGETELVKQVGIALNLQQTLNVYASQLGTTAEKLSVFQRQQALANAILTEGERVLGGVEIDPNPYEQLASSFQDLGREAVDTLSILDPLIVTIKDSGLLLGAIMVALGSSIAVKALPAITQFSSQLEENVHKQKMLSAEVVAFKEAEANAWIFEERRKVKEGLDSLKATEKYAKASKQLLSFQDPKAPKTKTASLLEAGFQDKDGNLDKTMAKKYVRLTTTALKLATSELKGNNAIKGLPNFIVDALIAGKSEAVAATRDVVKSMVAEVEEGSTAIERRSATMAERVKKSILKIQATSSLGFAQIQQSFANSMSAVQSEFLEKGVGAGFNQIGASVKLAGERAAVLPGIFKAGAQAAAGLGGAISFAVTGLTKISGIITTVTIALTVLTTAWTYLKKLLPDTAKANEKFNKGMEELNGNLEETAKKTDQLEILQSRFKDTIKSTASELNFLAGAYADYRDIVLKTSLELSNSITVLTDDISHAVSKQNELYATISSTGIADNIFLAAAAADTLSGEYGRAELAASKVRRSQDDLIKNSVNAFSTLGKVIRQTGALSEKSSIGINVGDLIIKDLEKSQDKVQLTIVSILKASKTKTGEALSDFITQSLGSFTSSDFEKIPGIMDKIDASANKNVDTFTEYQKVSEAVNNNFTNYAKTLLDLQTKDLIDKETVATLGSVISQYDAAIKLIQQASGDLETQKDIQLQIVDNFKAMPAPLKDIILTLGQGANFTAAFLDGTKKLKAALESISSAKALAKSSIELNKLIESSRKADLANSVSAVGILSLNKDILVTQENQINNKIKLNDLQIIELGIRRKQLQAENASTAQVDAQIRVLEEKNKIEEINKLQLERKLDIEKQLFDLYKQELDLVNKIRGATNNLYSTNILGILSERTKLTVEYLKTETDIANILNQQYQSQVNIKNLEKDRSILTKRTDLSEDVVKDGIKEIERRIALEKEFIRVKDSERGLLAASILDQNKKLQYSIAEVKQQNILNEINKQTLQQAKELSFFGGRAAELEAETARKTLDITKNNLLIKKSLLAVQEASIASDNRRLEGLRKQGKITEAANKESEVDLKNRQANVALLNTEIALEQVKLGLQTKESKLKDAQSFDRSFRDTSSLIQSEAEAFGILFANSFEEAFKNIKGPLETTADNIIKITDSSIENLGAAIVDADVTLRDAAEAIKETAREAVKEYFVNSIKTAIGTIGEAVFGPSKDDAAEMAAKQAAISSAASTSKIASDALAYYQAEERRFQEVSAQGKFVGSKLQEIFQILQNASVGATVNTEGGVNTPNTTLENIPASPAATSASFVQDNTFAIRELTNAILGIGQGDFKPGTLSKDVMDNPITSPRGDKDTSIDFNPGATKGSGFKELVGATKGLADQFGVTGMLIKDVGVRQALAVTENTVAAISNKVTEQAVAAQEAATTTTLIGTMQLLYSAMLANTAAMQAGNTAAVIPNAFGGIIPATAGPAPKLAAYAEGGITNGPTFALMGEGENREAVVPLPNNREIPVDLKGGQGGDNISISQNFDFRNADANSVARLRAEARNIEDRTFAKVFSEINRGGKFAKMTGRRK